MCNVAKLPISDKTAINDAEGFNQMACPGLPLATNRWTFRGKLMQLFVSVAPSYVMTIQVRMTKLWQAHVNLRQ